MAVPRWSVAPGARLALQGPSGSGKTTLLALLCGELPPTSGAVRVGEVDLHHLPDTQRAAFRLARVGQVLPGASLIPWLTVRENVLLPYRLGPALMRDGHAGDRADRLLDELGLGTRSMSRPEDLSTGERQRVGVARALVTQPAILLADEPTSALDEPAGRAVMEAIDRMCAARGTTAIVVTHDEAVAASLPERMNLLDLRAAP